MLQFSVRRLILMMGSGRFFVARVGSAIFGLGLDLENFP